MNNRIYLSPPNLSDTELVEVTKVFASGWISPVGPAIDEFENTLGLKYPDKKVLALNSGTSALHLAIRLAGVADGDEVLVSSFTFAACANVILYERAIPVFIDSDKSSWNLDPEVLEDYLKQAKRLPKAVIVTHLYGMPADILRIISIAKKFNVKVIEDAAESLGSKFDNEHLGSFGDYGVVSFNGNKIVTTSGGGALICSKEEWSHAKYLASQANSGNFGYNHNDIGFNYRLSNVLAGVGLAQLAKLELFVDRKRMIYSRYEDKLDEHFDFLTEPEGRYSNRWLTTAVLKNDEIEIEELILYLNEYNIETRRLWKPLHLNKAYSDASFIGNGVSEELFNIGICLPSGTSLKTEEQEFVIERINDWFD